MSDDLLRRYSALYREVLMPVASRLEQLIRNHLEGTPRIDRVSTRAKAPERFIAKARKSSAGGVPKYSAPLEQIQDQIGARVIVFYKQDVDVVSDIITRYFRHIEARVIVPESEWTFGYFGKHYVLSLPPEAVPPDVERERAPAFFELQIKTLWQHAWSEAEHDLGYKPPDQLTDDQKRRLAFTAAQAWGADRTFQELFQELVVDGGTAR